MGVFLLSHTPARLGPPHGPPGYGYAAPPKFASYEEVCDPVSLSQKGYRMKDKLTQKVIAEHIDLSVRQVQRLLADGVLDQRETLADNRVRYIRHIRSFANGFNQTANPQSEIEADPGTLEYEKLRLTRAQADAQELKNEIARAEVAPIDLLKCAMRQAVAQACAILDAVPLSIKRRHPQLETLIIESIKRHIVKAMNAIASMELDMDRVVEEYNASLSEL